MELKTLVHPLCILHSQVSLAEDITKEDASLRIRILNLKTQEGKTDSQFLW